jgi:hypothetical protein
MELLSRLLGGVERVKIMRYFLHHENALVSLSDIAEKTKSKSDLVKKEVNALHTIGFLEKKKTKTFVLSGATKKTSPKIKEVNGYMLNNQFPHNVALKELLFDFKSFDTKELFARFKLVGRIKMLLVAGVFIGSEKSRVDVLLVGESINRAKAEKVFEGLSAEFGRDITYAIMDVEEYEYRFKMYDKFVRDIVEMENVVVVDKLRESKNTF